MEWRFAGNDDKKNIVFKGVELSVDEFASPTQINLEHWLRIHSAANGPRGETCRYCQLAVTSYLCSLEAEDAAELQQCGVSSCVSQPTGHLAWTLASGGSKDWLESFAGNMLTYGREKYRRKVRTSQRIAPAPFVARVANTRCGGHRGSSCRVVDACSSCECEAQHQLVFLASLPVVTVTPVPAVVARDGGVVASSDDVAAT